MDGLFFAGEHFIDRRLPLHGAGNRQLCGFVVELVNLLVVGSGRVNEHAAHDDEVFGLLLGNHACFDGVGHGLVYYSLVTLTTVGYGDITPVHSLARSLATAEALIGQLYPAILIARLVSLEVESRQRG